LKILERSGQLLSSWEVGRHYRLTDADGRRPDWGTLDVDYSRHPASLLEVIMDAAQVQTEWLKVLSRRTERFRNSLLKKMKHPRSDRKNLQPAKRLPGR
jgi:hypothetical protein